MLDQLGDEEESAEKSKRHHRFRLGRAFLITLLTIMVTTLGAGLLWLNELGVFGSQDGRLKVIVEWKTPENTMVFDRGGRRIAEFFSHYRIHKKIDEIPSFLLDAVTAVEDRNFWEHSGVDPLAMLRALWAHLKGPRRFPQGASTITQQLVRHFLLSREKTIARKVDEIGLALRLEQQLSKERILELYVNNLYLGNGAYGVAAAAERYFHRPLEKLQPHEMALIAGLFQSPSRYNPIRYPDRAKARQRRVIRALWEEGKLSKKQAIALVRHKIRYTPYESSYGKVAPYFIDHVRQETMKILQKSEAALRNLGLRIYTTLDIEVALHVERAIAQKKGHFAALAQKIEGEFEQDKRPEIEVAALVVDAKSGNILALQGGRDFQASQFNRAISAHRSPGSAFKPLLYAYALNQGFKWSDVMYVQPITVGDFYRPRTPTSDYLTETTLLRAFYRSMNAPAVELSARVGVKGLIRFARKLGVESELPEEYGLALGSSAVTPYEMAQVYQVFANGGKKLPLSTIQRIEDREGKVIFSRDNGADGSEQVIDSRINFLMLQAMRDVLRIGTGHTFSELSVNMAGKTGTSNFAKDNWFCGFSSDTVTIVWVGTDRYLPLRGGVTGGVAALPVWASIMKRLQRIRKFEDWPQEMTGVTDVRVHPQFGFPSDDGVRMWFLDDNLPDMKNAALEAVNRRKGFRRIFRN